MDAVFAELNAKTQEWINWQIADFEEAMGSTPDDDDEYRTSPFWLYSMSRRYDEGDSENYADIIEKVRYDYVTSIHSDRRLDFDWTPIMSSKEYILHRHIPRINYWKQSIQEKEAEKVLMLYNKVPVDILNEVIKFIY